MKERKEQNCAVTGTADAPSALLRFVVSPEGQVVFDRRQGLPGEALWLSPQRHVVEEAMRAGVFHSLSASSHWPDTLADEVEAQLRAQALGNLNLLRRSGALIAGFEKVRQVILRGDGQVVVQAADASEEGRQKLVKLAGHHHIPVIDCFLRDELAQVTGQENQSHIALLRGGLADKFIAESRFFLAFRGE